MKYLGDEFKTEVESIRAALVEQMPVKRIEDEQINNN